MANSLINLPTAAKRYILKPDSGAVFPAGVLPEPIYISGLGSAVGANKATTVAHATDAASAITQLNAVIDALRAAGLMA